MESASTYSPAPPQSNGPIGERLIERLHELQQIVPAMAEELSGAERECAQLRAENSRLTAELRRMRRLRSEGASRAMLRVLTSA